MKMKYILPAALMAVLFAGCNKAEVEIPGNTNDGIAEIKAEIVNTKTTYDDTGKFSWVSTDKLTVVVYNDGSTDASKLNVLDHWTFNNSTGAGETATFTGSAINAPWHELGVALYPNKNMSTYNLLQEAGTYDTGLKVVVNQEIRPDLSNPLEVVPLIGRKNSNDVYQFKTAMGILQVTVTDIPADAYYLYLQDPNNSFAFSGTFAVGDQDEIREEDAVSPSGNAFKKTIAFTPQSAGETRTFYFPVPVGTIPAGTVLKLDKGAAGGYANIMTKTLKNPITITANHVTPLKAVAAEGWVTLGTGKFTDNNGFYATSSTTPYVDVTIQKHSSNDGRYRVVNPYRVYIDQLGLTQYSGMVGPDPYFYFTLVDDHVESADYHPGLCFYQPWYNDTYGEFRVVNPWSVSGYNKWNNFVLKYDTDNVTPLNVQIAPLYYYYNNAYVQSCVENPKIEIVFPGSTEMLTVANYANSGTISCDNGTITATLGNAAITAIKVVLAASLDAGVAALKAGTGDILNFTASGTQSFSSLTAGTTYHVVYKVETDGHGYTFKDGGAFTAKGAGQITLTTSNVTACCSSRYSGDNGGVAALVDGDPSTHWHAIYYDAYTTNDPTYGVYFDIDLGSSPIQKFQFKFKARASNCAAAPTVIKYAVSNDGTTWTTNTTWVDNTGLTASSAGGSYVTLSAIDAGAAYRYIRFGIVDSTNTSSGSLTGDLDFTGWKKTVNMAELELYEL